jgi:hypothetical protein
MGDVEVRESTAVGGEAPGKEGRPGPVSLWGGGDLAPEALDLAAEIVNLLLLLLSMVGEGLVGDSGDFSEGASVWSGGEGSNDGDGGAGLEGFIHVYWEVRVVGAG